MAARDRHSGMPHFFRNKMNIASIFCYSVPQFSFLLSFFALIGALKSDLICFIFFIIFIEIQMKAFFLFVKTDVAYRYVV